MPLNASGERQPSMKPQRICIVTAGQLSTTPRMLKAADALAAEGHDVRVVANRIVDWAVETDAVVLATRAQLDRTWRLGSVDTTRSASLPRYLRSRISHRGARVLTRRSGAGRVPLRILARALMPSFADLVNEVLREPFDIVYGGGGSLPVAFAAARRAGKSYALDLEDFHSGIESEQLPEGRFQNELVGRCESLILEEAAFLTAGSPMIAEAYTEKYGVPLRVIHNVFPLPQSPPPLDEGRSGKLSLYWFSQTIGPTRLLEEVIHACGLAAIPVRLHLRGRVSRDYWHALLSLAAARAPDMQLEHLPPAAPDAMVPLSCGYDVGLSVETPNLCSRSLALTNKLFTYLAAGLAVVMSNTPAHDRMAKQLPECVVSFDAGNPATLAAGFKALHENRSRLLAAKRASWEAAKSRWHWEHPDERGSLLCAFTKVGVDS